MLSFIKRYRAFIITLITGAVLFFITIYIVVAAIFGNDIKIITPIGIVIWCTLRFPLGYISEFIFKTDNGTFIGIWIDIVLYSFLVQFLWNKWRKRKQSQPKS